MRYLLFLSSPPTPNTAAGLAVMHIYNKDKDKEILLLLEVDDKMLKLHQPLDDTTETC